MSGWYLIVWSASLESSPKTGIAWGWLTDGHCKTWACMDGRKAALSRGRVGVSRHAVNCSLSSVLWSWGGSSELSQTEGTGLLLSIPAPVYFGPWPPLESCVTLNEVVSPSQGHFPARYTAAAWKFSHRIWGENFRISDTRAMAFAFRDCVSWCTQQLSEHLVMKWWCYL